MIINYIEMSTFLFSSFLTACCSDDCSAGWQRSAICQLSAVLLKYVVIHQLWAGGQRGTTFKYQVTSKSIKTKNMPSILPICPSLFILLFLVAEATKNTPLCIFLSICPSQISSQIQKCQRDL